jgi:hypothetical protein
MPWKVYDGVYLPPLKAKIFDLLRKTPLSLEAINARCFGGDAKSGLIHQHISQINAMLASGDLSISGNVPGARGYYQIVKRKLRK